MRTLNGKWATFVWVFSRICLAVCVISPVVFPHTRCAASEALSISEILNRVRQRYTGADFEADFVQESYLPAMGIVDSAEGHVYFKPPAMMRWHYKVPEEYFIITDGETLWMYRPQDNQVMLGRAAQYLGDTKAVGLLSNPARVHEDFVVEPAPKEFWEKGQHVLKLVPRRQRSDLAKLFLFISNTTFDIVQSVSYNALGDRSSIRFSGLRFDQGLNPSLFVFKIPHGADVVQLETQ